MKNFLVEVYICYFCIDELHNFETIVLADGRLVQACDGCNRTVLKIQRRYGQN